MEYPEGIHRIVLPRPRSNTGDVNAYWLDSSDGCALIDCGEGNDATLESLERQLRVLGRDLSDIRTLIVTHAHVDHYGLAGTLVKLVKPRLLMHRVDWLYARTRLDGDSTTHGGVEWMQKQGLSLDGRTDRELRLMVPRAVSGVVPPDAELEDWERIRVAGHTLTVLWTPGHAEGHICLYDAESRLLVAGDHVLKSLTPSVIAWDPMSQDPLGNLIASLKKVTNLEVDLVLPGHGEPFTNLHERAKELVAHHEQRERVVVRVLSRLKVATPAEVAAQIPWTQKGLTFEQLPILRQRPALGQTAAHLEKLRAAGEASGTMRDGRMYYELTSTTSRPGM